MRKNRLAEVVSTSTHNICFEQTYEKYQNFLSENFHFLVVKFSVYLIRRVVVTSRFYRLFRYALRSNLHDMAQIIIPLANCGGTMSVHLFVRPYFTFLFFCGGI